MRILLLLLWCTFGQQLQLFDLKVLYVVVIFYYLGPYGVASTYFNPHARHCYLHGYIVLHDYLQVITVSILIEICYIDCILQIVFVVQLIVRSYCTITINCNLLVCIIITIWIAPALFVLIASLYFIVYYVLLVFSVQRLTTVA